MTVDKCIARFKEIPRGDRRKGRRLLENFFWGGRECNTYSTACVVYTMEYVEHGNL